jgi:hypothetical protein
MKITKEDLLNSEFLKQFKDSGELDGFLSELHKFSKLRHFPPFDFGRLDSFLSDAKGASESENTSCNDSASP